MQLLPPTQYHLLIPLTKSLDPGAASIAGGVLEGIQPGKVLADEINNPQAALIATSGGSYLVLGKEDNQIFLLELVTYLKEPANHPGYYDLYTSSDLWLDTLTNALEGHSLRLPRSHWTYTAPQAPQVDISLEEGYELKPFDKAIYQDLKDFLEDSWGSQENFLQHGFGHAIIHQGKPVSFCWVCTLGGGHANVGVWTLDDYRHKGLALLTSAAYVQECLERKLVAVWDAGAANHPSLKLAEKLGYTKLKDAHLLFWHANREVLDGYLDGTRYM